MNLCVSSGWKRWRMIIFLLLWKKWLIIHYHHVALSWNFVAPLCREWICVCERERNMLIIYWDLVLLLSSRFPAPSPAASMSFWAHLGLGHWFGMGAGSGSRFSWGSASISRSCWSCSSSSKSKTCYKISSLKGNGRVFIPSLCFRWW